MLAERTLVVLILVPAALVIIVLGGALYVITIAMIMGLGAWEYGRLFQTGGLQPAGAVLVAGAVLLVLGRAWNGFTSAGWLLTLVIFSSMAVHLIAYERGSCKAGTDFGITLSGAIYFGWLGAYLISLRNLPSGEWWVLLALPTVWFVDMGAYLVGSQFGRHAMSPRLSPRKTWEGFTGGVLFGVFGGAALVAVFQRLGMNLGILPWQGGALGLVLALLTPLGDLGESMIKRQVGAKDSGKLLPGHGGAFDRIDSWLWAAAISYYMVIWLFMS